MTSPTWPRRPAATGMPLVAGGKTSTITQFTELARQAGLEILAAGSQASGRFVVECRPIPAPAREAAAPAREAAAPAREATGPARRDRA